MCVADVTAKVNKTVAERSLMLGWDFFAEYFFDTKGVLQLLGIEAEPATDADTMRVSDNSGDAEHVTKQEICNLSSDSGESAEGLYVTGKR